MYFAVVLTTAGGGGAGSGGVGSIINAGALLPHLLLTCGPASPEVELACCACGLCVLQQGGGLAARAVERQAAAERVPPE